MDFATGSIAVIMWLCALLIGAIALWALKRKTPMHFWSGTSVSPEEITDIPAYNRANALMWAVYAACMAISGLVSLFSIRAGVVLLILICVPGIFVLIVAYKRIYNKYKSPDAAAVRSKRKLSKKAVYAAVAVSLVSLIAVAAIFYYGAKEPDISVDAGGIHIDAMYGRSIDFTRVSDISLIEGSMREIGVGIRTNGYGGIGGALKGHFESESAGKTLLFVQAGSSPTIRIERVGEKDVYISFRDGEKTRQLYYEMTTENRH